MDMKIFGTTFLAIFIAELGDKTQLATLALAAESRQKLTIFVASALALIASSGLAVMGSTLISRFISPVYLNKGAGILFIILGVLSLVER
jgi:putative Ca2+/H+ antiporter (TMEM165/GDT1 family)